MLETPSPGPWALLGCPVLTHLVSLSPFPEHMLSLLRAQEPGVGVGGDGGLQGEPWDLLSRAERRLGIQTHTLDLAGTSLFPPPAHRAC